MKQVIFVVFALLLGVLGYYLGTASGEPKIRQLEADLAISQKDYRTMDVNRPNLDEVQRQFCSLTGFHEAITATRDLTMLSGRVVEMDDDFNLTFQEIYDATIISQHTVKLAGVTIRDKQKAKSLMQQMLLDGYPEPRTIVVMPADPEDEIPAAIVASHAAFNGYAFTYVQGELLDAQAAVVGNNLNPKMKTAMDKLQKYGLKPMFDPTKKPRMAKPRE